MAKQFSAEKLFTAESNSAAGLQQERLNKYSRIASEMFNTRVISAKEMAFPAIGNFAKSVLTGINAYQTLYFVNVLKIDMVYVAAILALIAIYDILNNPLMGIAYDRTRTRWGKARPYLLFSPIPFYLTTAVLYSGALFLTSEQTNDPKKIIFVFMTLFVQETFSTIYSIPRDNFVSLMSPNPEDRITLGLVLNYAGTYGSQIIPLIFMPLQDLNNMGITNVPMPALFAVMGCFCSFVGIAGNMTMAVGCKERIMLQPKPAPITKNMFVILKNKYQLRNFIAGFFASFMGNGNYSWDVVTQLEIFGGAIRSFIFYLPYNIMNPLSVVLVPKFRKIFKNNNKRAYLTLGIWDISSYLCMWLVGRNFIGNPWLVGAIFGLFYFMNAFNNGPYEVFSQELGREINDYTEYVSGERPDGTSGLIPGLVSSLARPFNALMSIAVFKWTKYDTTIQPSYWSQGSKDVYRKVLFLYCAFECIGRIISIIPYFFYDLTGKKREAMYIALNERRALVANEMSDEMKTMLETVAIEDEEENKSEIVK